MTIDDVILRCLTGCKWVDVPAGTPGATEHNQILKDWLGMDRKDLDSVLKFMLLLPEEKK